MFYTVNGSLCRSSNVVLSFAEEQTFIKQIEEGYAGMLIISPGVQRGNIDIIGLTGSTGD